MQEALAVAQRLASMLSSNQSQDTIQQAMAVLDSVNKTLYGMIDQSSVAEPSKADPPPPSTTTSSLDIVRGYGDNDDDEDDYRPPQYGHGMESSKKRQSYSPTRSSGAGTSSQQRSTTGPSKRFHFGL